MNDNQNTPKLRFSGFEKEFEKKQFDTIFDIISNNTLSRDNLNYDGGSTQNVHYGDILTKFGEYVDTEKEILPFLNDEEVALKYQNATLKDGDIIIADTAEDEMVGKCIEIGNIGDRKILSGLHTIPCRLKEKYASKYMGYYLNSEAYHHKLLPLMQGVKVIAISKSGIQGTELLLSQDYAEQEKIGNFLFEIDEKMKYEKLKLDSIKTLKKSMLKKMFPKDGKRKPEIRFAGFTADWEYRKVSDLGNIVTGSTPPTKDKSNYDGEFLFVSPADIQGNRYVTNTITTLTEQGFNKGRILKEKSTLFVSIGSTIGKVAQILEKSTTNQQINAIEPYCEFDDDFVFTLMEKTSGQIKALAATQAVPIVNKTSFGEVEINVPLDIAEQTKIGVYFRNLDNLITLHQRELEKLENMKLACMKKMFV